MCCAQGLYPINKLRNIAQDSVETDFIFYVDIDFLMNPDLYSDVTDLINTQFFENSKVRCKLQVFDVSSDNAMI